MGTQSLRLCQCLPCGGWARSNTAAQTVDGELKPVLDNGVTVNEKERDRESRWEKLRRVLVAALLSTVLFFASCAYSIVGSFFPIEAEEKGSNSLTTAIIIGASPLCLAILSPFVGYFLPKLGIKLTLISGQVLVGGAFVLMGFLVYMSSATWFVTYGILMRLTEGVGWAMTTTTSYALLPFLFPSRFATLTGILFFGSGLGFTLGPPIGSLLVVAAGYGAPFWILGGVSLSVVPLACFLVKETSSSTKVLLPLLIVFKLHSHLSFLMIQICNMVSSASLTFMDAALAVYLHAEVGLNLFEIGLYFAVLSVTYVLGSVPAGLLSDKFGTRNIIVTGMFVDGTSLILLGISPLIPLPRRWTNLFTLALIGFGAAIGYVPVYSDLLQQAQKLYPEVEEEAMVSAVSGVTAFSLAFGGFIGAILGGFFTYFISFPKAVLILGEAVTAHAFLVLGVTLIDHMLNNQFPTV